MPCHAAMNKDALTVSPEQEVGEVLALMKKKKVTSAAVVDDKHVLQGVFSIQILFKNLLPVSVSMAGGLQADIAIQAAPGIAKRLKKVEALPVSDLMNRKFDAVYPETPTWEGVNYITQHGPPLMVIEKETGKFLGLINYESALEEIQRLKDSES